MGNDIRVGIGKSICKYSNSNTLKLGGIDIPLNNVDHAIIQPDCLFKAISDALLGAAGLGGVEQITELNEKLGNNESELIKEIDRKVHYCGYKIINIDASITTRLLTIASHISQICQHIADVIFIKPEQINLKINNLDEPSLYQNQNIIDCTVIVLLKKR